MEVFDKDLFQNSLSQPAFISHQPTHWSRSGPNKEKSECISCSDDPDVLLDNKSFFIQHPLLKTEFSALLAGGFWSEQAKSGTYNKEQTP